MDRGAWRTTVNGVAKELDTTERLTLVLINPVLSPFVKKIILSIYLFLDVLGLCCCEGFSLSAVSEAYSLLLLGLSLW